MRTAAKTLLLTILASCTGCFNPSDPPAVPLDGSTSSTTTPGSTGDSMGTSGVTTAGTSSGPTTTFSTSDTAATADTVDTKDTSDTAGTEGAAGDTSSGGAEMAEIRLLHLGVDIPDVDVFANGEGRPVIENLVFRAGTDYLVVPAGDNTFHFSVSGSEKAFFTLAPTLDAGTKYTAVMFGEYRSATLDVLTLVDDDASIGPANTRITLIHAAPRFGEVNFWDSSTESLLLSDPPLGGSATLPDTPAIVLELFVGGPDFDSFAFSVPTAALGGLQVNAFFNNDSSGGVNLLMQLPDGSTLPVLPN